MQSYWTIRTQELLVNCRMQTANINHIEIEESTDFFCLFLQKAGICAVIVSIIIVVSRIGVVLSWSVVDRLAFCLYLCSPGWDQTVKKELCNIYTVILQLQRDGWMVKCRITGRMRLFATPSYHLLAQNQDFARSGTRTSRRNVAASRHQYTKAHPQFMMEELTKENRWPLLEERNGCWRPEDCCCWTWKCCWDLSVPPVSTN